MKTNSKRGKLGEGRGKGGGGGELISGGGVRTGCIFGLQVDGPITRGAGAGAEEGGSYKRQLKVS